MGAGQNPWFAGEIRKYSCKSLILNNFILPNFSSFCHMAHLARLGGAWPATYSQSYAHVL
jgi:hypothetical protein